MFSSNTSQVSDEKLYSEDVFSTFLYTGNGSTQTITNGIDLAGKGGLVWIKSRTDVAKPCFFDTARGVSKSISSNNTNAQVTFSGVDQFNSTSFRVNSDAETNSSSNNYASWTFRKAPKFFDVVTYTGNGADPRSISHSLGVKPGCIIIKRTDTTSDWMVYHRGTQANPSDAWINNLRLNTTGAVNTNTGIWDDPTSTSFIVKGDALVNANGATYVAYLFAHDTTSDGIIQCGSFTNDGSGNATVTLGWEPQWLLLKKTAVNSNWQLYDNMRGFFAPSQVNKYLYPNSSGAEGDDASKIASPTATGFTIEGFGLDQPVIYIAIRRGPMRTPTLGTSVFSPAYGNNMSVANANAFTSGFATDLLIRKMGSGSEGVVQDALRGIGNQLYTEQTAAEASSTSYFRTQTGIARTVATDFSGWIGWNFRRAPSFFDVVCYTGTGSARTVNHNLGVAPELMIIKSRSSGGSSQYNWMVYSAAIWGTGVAGYPGYDLAVLNTTAPAYYDNALLNNTQPSASVFSLGTGTQVNSSGVTYLAYLFGSCPGVSKCGSYTGNGSNQTINCGFAAGARFVMIKRADSTGDWYVWDTARGIVSSNDPHLSLNSTAAEVTTDDSVDTDSSGFVVNQLSATNINVNAATYLYMAVA